MHLVRDRVAPDADRPTWWAFANERVQQPVPLAVPQWRLDAGDMWLVTGPNAALASVVALLRYAGPAATGAGLGGQTPQLRVVANDEALLASLRAHSGRRWFGLRRPASCPAVVADWLAPLGPGNALERVVLGEIARAVADADVLVLDRVLHLLRPEVRFRVATYLRDEARLSGRTLVATAEEPLEGWIAVERRAAIARGVLQLEMS